MCWSVRVYLTVLHNLFIKFCTNIANFITNKNNHINNNNNDDDNNHGYNQQSFCNHYNCCDKWYCSWCCCCWCCQQHCLKSTNQDQETNSLSIMETTATPVHCIGSVNDPRTIRNIQHDYVIVGKYEIDADYLEIERRKIETECYYRTIDRTTAEDFLIGREDGACLVRPFKEPDITIKYIVSVFAQGQFFHLFIRQIFGREVYGIGQAKPNEKLFTSPTDIIDFYSYNPLFCTNKNISLSLLLKPITV